jgi:lysophospholipase L1-like esterase
MAATTACRSGEIQAPERLKRFLDHGPPFKSLFMLTTSLLPFGLPFLGLFAAFALASVVPAGAAPVPGILPQTGDKIAFLGDSITANGNRLPGGYLHLVADGLEQAGVKITIIPAGISGNTSKDMLARLDRDVLSKKPQWMTLSCGVNDVWHGVNGVDLPTYKQNITSIVDQAQAAGIKVVIMTSTMIGEEDNANNQKLAAYNDFLRSLAAERKLPITDLNADEHAELADMAKDGPLKGNVLTMDGVHPNGLGNEMMAAGLLKAFGVPDADVAKAREDWLKMPDTCDIVAKASTSARPRTSRSSSISTPC